MKKINKALLIFGIVLLLVISGLTASMIGILSVTDNTGVQMLNIDCNVPNDCYVGLVQSGFVVSELDEQLKDAELVCMNKKCGVVRK